MVTAKRQPPYLQIVADLQARISSGDLRPGQPVPSTRRIVREWGVAMATAAKALATLRQQGWVRTVPGSATLVLEGASRPRPESAARERDEPELTRDRLVRTAISLADTHGRAALSMRRLAAEVGVGAMSLYRYVPDKDELLRLMADAAFGEERLPEPGPTGWRAKLELAARLQWRAYRRHPWMVAIMHNSLIWPPTVASGIRFVDWELGALSGLGLDERTALHTILALDGYVGGIAASNALEVESEQRSGVSGAQRMAADRQLRAQIFESEPLPNLMACLTPGARTLADLDDVFERGLGHQLDGIGAMLAALR